MNNYIKSLQTQIAVTERCIDSLEGGGFDLEKTPEAQAFLKFLISRKLKLNKAYAAAKRDEKFFRGTN